jgi:hypothetical protein
MRELSGQSFPTIGGVGDTGGYATVVFQSLLPLTALSARRFGYLKDNVQGSSVQLAL